MRFVIYLLVWDNHLNVFVRIFKLLNLFWINACFPIFFVFSFFFSLRHLWFKRSSQKIYRSFQFSLRFQPLELFLTFLTKKITSSLQHVNKKKHSEKCISAFQWFCDFVMKFYSQIYLMKWYSSDYSTWFAQD